MHFASVYSVLSTAALFAFTNAVPTAKQLNGIAGPGKFELHCDLPKGRFDGYCSVDPCGRMNWCPDYLDGAYVPKDVVVVPDPSPKNTTITCTDCQNGKVPPPTPSCSSHLPPKVTASCTSSTPSVTISHSCSTSTTSSCTTSTTTSCTTHPSVPAVPPPPPKDECHCKDDSEKPSEPASVSIEQKPKQFYRCANNGFEGSCSIDPCALEWCPDYPKPTKSAPVPVEQKPKQFYTCANNGFHGMCSVDPCAITWCPDYESRTYIPIVKSQ